jgi:hypothetical protein
VTNLLVLVLFERGSVLGFVTLPVLAVFGLLAFVFGVRGVRSVAVMESLEERLANVRRAYVGATLATLGGIAFMMFLLGLLQFVAPEPLKIYLHIMTGWYV